MSLIILSSRCRFSDCFKAFSNAGIVTSISEWFQMALNKLAIITTQFLLQQNEASRRYKWIHHYCPFLSAILPAVGPDSGNEGLAALTVLFHMFLKQSSHSIVPHPSPSRHNIPMQWGQVRQKWIRQINRDTAAREHYSIWCATEKSWILKEEWNSALKLLLYCFSGPCIDLQPVSLTCIIYKMGPRRMNMFESLLIWSRFCYGCNSPVTYCKFIFHYINLWTGL